MKHLITMAILAAVSWAMVAETSAQNYIEEIPAPGVVVAPQPVPVRVYRPRVSYRVVVPAPVVVRPRRIVYRRAYVAPAPIYAPAPVYRTVVPRRAYYPSYYGGRPAVVRSKVYYPWQPVRNSVKVLLP